LEESALGTTYHNGEVIIRQGEKIDCMYIILSGKVEVTRENSGKEGRAVRITVLDEGRFFGTVPLFERLGSANTVRSTVRALGEVRVITVDKKTLLRRIHEDPSLAYRILETMSRRILELEEMVTRQAIN
jgi:CRP-like cAMP-binding protein